VLGTIRNTTLVLVGADDQTTPPAVARQLAASIAGARYAEIAGCGHCPQIQKPQELIALIDGFLA
jgi:pimeloyl-ACP methyl ester carboxylesterase